MDTPIFDPNRPHGTYTEKVGDQVYSYIGQDNCLFDRCSRLDGTRIITFVRRVGEPPTSAPPAQPSSSPTPQASPAGAEALTCKACGKTYKLGPSTKTAAIARQRIRDHLKKEHNIDIGEAPL